MDTPQIIFSIQDSKINLSGTPQEDLRIHSIYGTATTAWQLHSTMFQYSSTQEGKYVQNHLSSAAGKYVQNHLSSAAGEYVQNHLS